MADETERTIGGLTIRIDRLLCVGFGDCIAVAPEVFEFDDEGICVFTEDAPSIDRERLIQSCDICPVDALSVFSPEGEQLVP